MIIVGELAFRQASAVAFTNITASPGAVIAGEWSAWLGPGADGRADDGPGRCRRLRQDHAGGEGVPGPRGAPALSGRDRVGDDRPRCRRPGLAARISELIAAGDSGRGLVFTSPEQAGHALGRALSGRGRTLLVVDDVWTASQLAPFTLAEDRTGWDLAGHRQQRPDGSDLGGKRRGRHGDTGRRRGLRVRLVSRKHRAVRRRPARSIRILARAAARMIERAARVRGLLMNERSVLPGAAAALARKGACRADDGRAQPASGLLA